MKINDKEIKIIKRDLIYLDKQLLRQYEAIIEVIAHEKYLQVRCYTITMHLVWEEHFYCNHNFSQGLVTGIRSLAS
jgi:hypothetical protein